MSIKIERQGADRIRLEGWIGRNTPALCKAVGGGSFVPRDKAQDGVAHWTYPLDLATCRAMRSQFGDHLDIGSELNRWARKAVKAEAHRKSLKEQADGTLHRVPEVAPFLDSATLDRAYQRQAISWMAATGSCLLADQQGLGKSIETLGTIVESTPEHTGTKYHLVFSPSVAVDTVWTAEVMRWLDENQAVAVSLTGSLKQREQNLHDYLNTPTDLEHVFIVTNLEAARIKPHFDDVKDPDHKRPKYHAKDAVLPSLFSQIWDTVVVDECQRALIRTTGKKSQTRAGFEVLSRNAERRIALSGTPMRGKPEQLWGTLNWLRPDLYRSYWNWVKRYFHVGSNGFSNYVIGDFLVDGKERLAQDLADIMLRRTKAEVATDLPAKTYAGTHIEPRDPGSPFGIWLEPTKAQAKQLAEWDEDATLTFEDGSEIVGNFSIVEYTRSKQLANAVHGPGMVPTLDSPKYNWILEWLAEADGAKVVIASQFTELIKVFAEGLRDEGYAVDVLTGATSAKERKRMVREFQATGEGVGAQVFMLNTKAGGVALTLDQADYVILIDETTVPDDQEQVEDRCHRVSRVHNVTVYYLRTLGSLDEEVAYVAAARQSVGHYLMDGARGVEYARKLYHESRTTQIEETS